jgi:acyl-coenzyme A thioesterase PaaI-like protein
VSWCAKLLDEPGQIVEFPAARYPRPGGENSLLAQTLNTDDTISWFVLLYKRPEQPQKVIDESKALLALGSGVSGFAKTCHGGIVATILDEVMGELIKVNLAEHSDIPRTTYVTAYLNVTYARPVPTPGTILATARITKADGRKLYMEGTIEDGLGNRLAKGDSLFVGARERL